MTYQQGDIVFVNFPFDDTAVAKPRPALIAGKSRSKIGAYIIAKITSATRTDDGSFWLTNDMLSRPTQRPSQVRTNEIQTLSENHILHKFSNLNRATLKVVCEKIQQNFTVE